MKIDTAAIALMAGAGFAVLFSQQVMAQKKGAPPDATAGAVVIVVKATNACFSDMIRVAGYLVPRRMAIVNVDADGYRVTELYASEGDTVTSGQALARLTRQDGANPGAGAGAGGAGAGRPQSPAAVTLRAPAAGLVTKSTARLREMASPQADPLFYILVDNELELEVDIPSVHVSKLKSGETAQVSIAGGREFPGRVRHMAPDVDQKTQFGKARLTVGSDPSLRLGMFGRATIDASRSCGVAVPRSAVEHRTEGTSVHVVRDRTVELRQVKVGLLSDDSVEIREGLREGDTVVANAGTSLHNGDKVRPIFAGEFDQPRVR
jgi:multidrug efflux pump subunit AcrA (membrane-fusion protein)